MGMETEMGHLHVGQIWLYLTKVVGHTTELPVLWMVAHSPVHHSAPCWWARNACLSALLQVPVAYCRWEENQRLWTFFNINVVEWRFSMLCNITVAEWRFSMLCNITVAEWRYSMLCNITEWCFSMLCVAVWAEIKHYAMRLMQLKILTALYLPF